MGNGNSGKSRINSKKMISTLIFLVYCVVAILAGYHTYNVFALADPPFFALLGAVAVDGMLALTLYLIGSWYGDQRIVGFVGVILFAALSGGMQIIARKIAMGERLDPALQFCADYAVPISVTLSLLVLGTIKYFDQDSNGVPDFMEKGKQNQQRPSFEPPYREMPQPQIQKPSQHGNDGSQHGNGQRSQQLTSGFQGDRIPAVHVPAFQSKGVGTNGNGRVFGNEQDNMPRLVDEDNPMPPA